MSDGSNDTQTVTQEPPAWLQPYIQGGVEAGLGLYNQGGPQYYPNQTVTPFAPQTQQAFDLTTNRALMGSPVTQAAQDQVTSTLRGDYLNANPYLDATFEKAAQATRGALDTQYAGAGRDIVGGLSQRSDQLNRLATDIYGGNYQAERGRQAAMLPFANSLANQDYLDIAALQGVGGAVEGKAQDIINADMSRWAFEQERPEAALDRYLSRLSFNPALTGMTTQQPIYESQFGQALGGAAGAAGLGGMLGAGNPWMWALGGALGGLFG